MTFRLFARALMLSITLVLLSFPARTSAAVFGNRTVFNVPAGNVASAGPVLDEQHVIYGVALPRMHRPTCVSCGQKPFTNFRMQIYVRDYVARSGGIQVSPPRLLFTGPIGAQISLYAFHHGWLVYATVALGDRWVLFVRNVRTGKLIALDSPQREGTPSRFLHAGSDGRTVVWQSWTRIGGKTVSVIRLYSLLTGRPHLLLSGGSGPDYFYGYPEISANRVVFVKELPRAASQLFVANVVTGSTRALTPPAETNNEAAISGNIVVWMHGHLNVDDAHGLIVANLATGHRIALPRSSAQLPRIAAGRYVVFATDLGRSDVQVYDTLTSKRWIISGSTPAYSVETGGHVVLFTRVNPCGAPNLACPGQVVMVALP